MSNDNKASWEWIGLDEEYQDQIEQHEKLLYERQHQIDKDNGFDEIGEMEAYMAHQQRCDTHSYTQTYC